MLSFQIFNIHVLNLYKEEVTVASHFHVSARRALTGKDSWEGKYLGHGD